jgi:hypothetical protein
MFLGGLPAAAPRRPSSRLCRGGVGSAGVGLAPAAMVLQPATRQRVPLLPRRNRHRPAPRGEAAPNPRGWRQSLCGWCQSMCGWRRPPGDFCWRHSLGGLMKTQQAVALNTVMGAPQVHKGKSERECRHILRLSKPEMGLFSGRSNGIGNYRTSRHP